MGADFVSEIVPVTRTKDEAWENLLTLKPDQIIRQLQYSSLGFEWFEEGYVWDENTGDAINIRPDILFPEIERCLHVVYDALEGLLRDAGWYRFDDCTFVVAGGMSWGDAPENCNELYVIKELGLTYDISKELAWVDRKKVVSSVANS